MARITALIFAKYPEPGTVNTRMVPPLTADEAAALHEAALAAVCERVAGVIGLDTRLVVTPDEHVSELHKRFARHIKDCWPQGNGDLGHRLIRATHRAFAGGADGVVLLGADSPTLPTRFLTHAAAALREHDAVMGPCEDGGYYLLGLRQPYPALFERIDWGGANVADQTGRRAVDGGIDLYELPSWYDLDRFEDLKRTLHDLAETAEQSLPALVALGRLITTYVER